MFYEIHRYGVPTCGDRERFEQAIGFVSARLDSAADCAGVAIVLHEFSHARPGIISPDKFDGLVLAIVACKGVVMLEPENAESKVIVVWDIDSFIEK